MNSLVSGVVHVVRPAKRVFELPLSCGLARSTMGQVGRRDLSDEHGSVVGEVLPVPVDIVR